MNVQFSAFDVSTYRWQNWVTVFVAVVAVGFGVFSLSYFLNQNFPKTRQAFIASPLCVFILFFWTFALPAWFYIEYFILWAGEGSKDIRADVLNGQKLAQPFWAAILATLLFLVPR